MDEQGKSGRVGAGDGQDSQSDESDVGAGTDSASLIFIAWETLN
jgi:hypothetical protein